MRFSAIALLIAFSLTSCEKQNSPMQQEEAVQQALDPELPATPFSYSTQAFPEEWLTDPALQLFGNIGSEIEVTDAGATLGRVLFYDPSMSADGTVSCSSCHVQANAFSDSEAKSVGVSGVPRCCSASPTPSPSAACLECGAGWPRVRLVPALSPRTADEERLWRLRGRCQRRIEW